MKFFGFNYGRSVMKNYGDMIEGEYILGICLMFLSKVTYISFKVYIFS